MKENKDKDEDKGKHKKDFKKDYISAPYKNIPITKVIYHDISNNHKYKFIFVGQQTAATKKLVNKYISGEKLTDKEHADLDKKINFYNKKMNVEFNDKTTNIAIYYHIETNMSIKLFQYLIYYLIKSEKILNDKEDLNATDFLPDNQLLYVYNIKIGYKKIVSILNFLFKNEPELPNEIFINRILDMFNFNKDELIQRMKDTESSVGFLDRKIYMYTDLLYNESFYKLALSLPNILTIKYTINHNNNEYDYYKNHNINQIINNKDTKIDPKLILTDDTSYLFNNIIDYNRLFNNEIHVMIKNDMKKVLKNDIIDFYFPEHNRYDIDLDTFFENYKKFNEEIDTTINDKNTLKIIKNLNKNLILDIYDNNLNLNPRINLDIIYNNFSTNKFLPVIKYYIKNEPVNFKLNKDFVQHHDYSEIDSLLRNKLHPKIKNLLNNNYLQFKWRIEKGFMLTINLYDTGYIISFFDNEKYMNINKYIIPYSRLIRSTIKKIKDMVTLKIIPMPNIESLFHDTSGKIYYSNIITSNLQTEFKHGYILKIDKHSQQYYIGLIKRIIRESYNQFIVSDSTNNTLKLLYKQVNNFYNPDNISQFIYRFLRKKNITINNKLIKSLKKFLKKTFMISEKTIDDYIENIENYTTTIESDFLYGIEVTILFLPENVIQINYDTIETFESIKTINYYIDSIKKINFYLENILRQTNKLSKIVSEDKSISASKKKVSKSASIDIGDDIELSDFGDNLDLDLDLDLDLELGFGDDTFIDNEFDKDISDIRDMLDLKSNLDKDDDISISSKQDISVTKSSSDIIKGIEVQKFDSSKKYKFKEYMKQMRKHFDPNLFEVKGNNGEIVYSYGIKDCDNKQMRQPYIVTKQELDTYDPDSLTGYIKYRNNYYICPRIWDVKANAPISVKKFIENGFKSPYNKGLPIPVDKKNKIKLGDEYTVIVRKGTTDTYWEDETVKEKLPDVLKGTERDAFPGLAKPSNHPNKLCVPCCFKKQPKDYDPNKKEIQRFYKPNGFEKCNMDEKSTDDDQSSASFKSDELQRVQEINSFKFNCDMVNDFYILGETTELDKCKFGLLPENLDILLNNHQKLFLNKTNSNLINKCNVFLKRGINKNNIKYNFLESWSVIIKQSLNNLLKLMVRNLTPQLFMDLNNGELVNIYAASNLLPYSVKDLSNFKEFCKSYPEFLNMFDFDYGIVEELEYNEFNEMIEKDIESSRKLILIYKVFRAFYNYISHILNKSEYKNYLHFIDFLTRPMEWQKKGINLIIFDAKSNNIVCNPYARDTNKMAIVIMYSPFKFIPVINYEMIGKENIIKGVFDINHASFNKEFIESYQEKNKNINLLKEAANRKPALLKIIGIHKEHCISINTKVIDFLKILGDLVDIDNKFINNSVQIEFIMLSTVMAEEGSKSSSDDKKTQSGGSKNTKILIPIYPTNYFTINDSKSMTFLSSTHYCDLNIYLELHSLINVATDTELIKDFGKRFKVDQTRLKKIIGLFKKFDYKIEKIFYNPALKKIIGLKFKNSLVTPVIPMELDDKLIKQIDKIDEHIDVESVLYDFNYSVDDEFLKITNKNLFMNDLMYNNFKYQFSRIILLVNNKSQYKKIKNIITGDKDKDKNIQSSYNEIFRLMKDYVLRTGEHNADNKKAHKNNSDKKKSKKNNAKEILPGYKFKKVFKTKKLQCDTDPLMDVEKNDKHYQCKLTLDEAKFKYFCYLLAVDLNINYNEFLTIINGHFIPIFYQNNSIFQNTNDIQITPEELSKYIANGLYSNYKKNIQLMISKDDKYSDKLTNDSIKKITGELKKLEDDLNKGIRKLIEPVSSSTKGLSNVIYTTVFDKDGVYDKNKHFGICKFPFIKGNRLTDKCFQDDKDRGMICPVELDNNSKPTKYGYCPSRTSNDNVQQVKAYGDNKNKKFMDGDCLMPHLIKYEKNGKEIIKINYSCQKVINNEDKSESDSTQTKNLTWCPINKDYNNYNDNDPRLYIKAAINSKDIDKNPKEIKNIISKGNIIPKYINYKKKGYCQPYVKKDRLTKKLDMFEQEDHKPISLDTYNPQKCSLGIKKDGYSKIQLYNFGKNILDIDSDLMMNDDIIIKKDILCNLINKEFRKRKFKKENITDLDRVKAYTKDPNNCLETENKGGYYKKDLVEMAINYFNLDENEAGKMSKDDLCNYIIPKIKKIKKELESTASSVSKSISMTSSHVNYYYPGNLARCKDVPGRGGFNIRKLKEIALKNFNIDIKGKSKDELCDLIEDKVKTMQLDDDRDEVTVLDKKNIDTILDDDYEDKLTYQDTDESYDAEIEKLMKYDDDPIIDLDID